MPRSLQETDGWERIRLRIPHRYDREQHDCWLFRLWTKAKRLQWIKENIASLLTGRAAYALLHTFSHFFTSYPVWVHQRTLVTALWVCCPSKSRRLHLSSWIYVTSVFFFFSFWKQRFLSAWHVSHWHIFLQPCQASSVYRTNVQNVC